MVSNPSTSEYFNMCGQSKSITYTLENDEDGVY